MVALQRPNPDDVIERLRSAVLEISVDLGDGEHSNHDVYEELKEQYPQLVSDYIEVRVDPMLKQEIRQIHASDRKAKERGGSYQSIWHTKRSNNGLVYDAVVTLGNMTKEDHLYEARFCEERSSYYIWRGSVHKAIADRLNPGQKTSEVFTEAELAEMFEREEDQ